MPAVVVARKWSGASCADQDETETLQGMPMKEISEDHRNRFVGAVTVVILSTAVAGCISFGVGLILTSFSKAVGIGLVTIGVAFVGTCIAMIPAFRREKP
jgi:hypothetical protein